MAISVGSSYVEICSKEDGFLGSYYVAKVLAKKGKNKFMVEYTTLVKEEDEKELLVEVVEASEIRPMPPPIWVPEFKFLDEVDVFANDGWWVGRITGRNGYKYYVYFEKSSGDELAYPSSCLRPHQEYENGRWIPSQRKGDS